MGFLLCGFERLYGRQVGFVGDVPDHESRWAVAADHFLTQAANIHCPRGKRAKSIFPAVFSAHGVGQRKSVAWVKLVSAPTHEYM